MGAIFHSFPHFSRTILDKSESKRQSDFHVAPWWEGVWVLACCRGNVTVVSTADFGSWVTLTELNLGTNQLTILPDDIQELTRLEVLSLANNAIRVSGCGKCGCVWWVWPCWVVWDSFHWTWMVVSLSGRDWIGWLSDDTVCVRILRCVHLTLCSLKAH